MISQTCCFTGHREIPKQDLHEIESRTEEYIRLLVSQGVKYFGVGGALGYDYLAAQILFKLRATEYPGIKVILVYPFDGYINRWSKEQQLVYRETLSQYNKKVCVAEYPSKGAYLQRNRHLVNNSKYCITYCTRASGGTAYTVKYAKSKGLSIFNTADYNIDNI